MKTTTLLSILLMSLTLGLTACSDNAQMVASQRSPEFFSQFMNSPAEFQQAEAKLPELKMMEVGAEYPMRFVLFEDGRFYYQIDKLGDGSGYWKHQAGALELTAVRPIFDMTLYISAAQEAGDATVIRFNDRHGFNSVNIQYKAPVAPETNGGLIKASQKLRPYTRAPKDI